MSTQTIEVRHYLRAIASRMWLIIVVVAVAVSAVYWQAGGAPVQYTASATLLVSAPVMSTPATVLADSGFQGRFETVANDIMHLLTSRAIAERVAQRLKLTGPGYVQRSVQVAPVRGTSFIRVTAHTTAPELSANLANAVAEEGIAYFRAANRASTSEARRFVEEQLDRARARLAASEQAIRAFKELRQIPNLDAVSSQLMSQITQGQVELDQVEVARRENEARIAAAKARMEREQEIIVASRATIENPAFQRIQQRLIDLEIQRAQMSQVYTPQHPRMEQIMREIADVRGRLMNEARTSIAQEITQTNPVRARLASDLLGLEVERVAQEARLAGLRAAQQRRRVAAMSMPAAEAEFNRLMREHRVLESNYTALATRYQDVLLREHQAGFFPAGLQIVETALPPVQAAPTAFPRTAAAAGLVGLVLGVMAALFLEAVDDRARSAEDVERAFGVPVLAQIPAHGQPRLAGAMPVVVIVLILVALIAGAVWAGSPGSLIGGAQELVGAVVGTLTGR
jgi:succinoglycan biosynthesis transport protein ExoP